MRNNNWKSGILVLLAILLVSGCDDPENPVAATPAEEKHHGDTSREVSRWRVELSGKNTCQAILEITDLRSEDGCRSSSRLDFGTYQIEFPEGTVDCETLNGRYSGRDSSRGLNMSGIGKIYAINSSTLIVSGGNGNGTTSLLRSTDAGKRWRRIFLGSDRGFLSAYRSAQGPSGVLYLIQGDPQSQECIYRSSDLGETWEEVQTGLREVLRFKIHPSTGTLFAVTKSAPQVLLRSTDRGEHWHTCIDLGDERRPIRGFAIDDIGRVYIVTSWFQLNEPQFAVSEDDGASWSVKEIRLAGPFDHVTGLYAAGDGLLLVSSSSFVAGTTQSMDGGITWTGADFEQEYGYEINSAYDCLIFPGENWLVNTNRGVYYKRAEQNRWKPRFPGCYHGMYVHRTEQEGYVWATYRKNIYRAPADNLRFVQMSNPEPSYCSLILSRDGDSLSGTFIEQMIVSGPTTVQKVRGQRIR